MFEFDPMKHRPFRGVVPNSRDREELPQNAAYMGTIPSYGQVVFHSPQVLNELRKTVAKVENNVAQYIIWNPASTQVPKVIQPDRQTAIKVAGRMAHENPGQTFYVCKLTNSAVKPIPVDVKYEDLDR